MEDSDIEEDVHPRRRNDDKTELIDFLPAASLPPDVDLESDGNMPEIDNEEGDLSLVESSQVLLKSSETGRVSLVLKVLDKDSSVVNCRDEDGYTPLHRAAYNGHKEVVKILLQTGADITARTVDGWQPLHCACRWGKERKQCIICITSFQKGRVINLTNGQTEVASLLLQNGADINAQTNGKQTALHFAASGAGGTTTLQLLLCNRYLDPSLVNMQNETAYDIAKRSGRHHDLFEIVEECINVK